MPHSPLRHRLVAIGLLLLGSAGIAAMWILLAGVLDRRCSWMAVAAAADAALIVRLVRLPQGGMRAAIGVLATAIAIVLANWGIAATWTGRPLGMLPWESALRLGPEFGWLLARLGNGAVDLAWFAAAFVVAAVASR